MAAARSKQSLKERSPMNDTTQQNSDSFDLIGFDHLTLVVASVENSRKFYVDQLGFTEVQRPAFSFPGAWFEIGQSMIHVTESDDLSGKAGWGDRAVTRTSRGHHFAYRTSNFEQALRAIDSHEIEIASGPQTRPDGANQVYIYDPDRHLVEICS